MTAYEYMQKQARSLAGGVAWAKRTLEGRDRQSAHRFAPSDLIDHAVDIAWERLLLTADVPTDLVVEQRHNLLLFRAVRRTEVPAPAQTA